MSLPTLFSTCRPRADVLAGAIRDDEFMADLSRVVNGTAPADYLEPAAFFAKSYPTRGMKELLKAVCLRLSGKGGEVSSIIRLGTQCGGGKTHSLIALVHAVRGMQGVPHPENFVDPAILPAGAIRIAALDGENADPANGLTLEPGLLARSLWGEMAYRLAGRAGYERVRASDEKHIAPASFPPAVPTGVPSAGKKKPDASLAGAANDFQARKRVRKLAFAGTAPAPKIPEQIPRLLPDSPADNEG